MKLLFGFLLVSSPVGAASGQQARATAMLTVRAENTLGIVRRDETVSLPIAELRSRLGVIAAGQVRVKEAGSGGEIVSQVVDDDGDGAPDALIFQASFLPRETRSFLIERGAPSMSAPPRVHVMHDAERDDIAWESDRIAFRTYGVGLAKLEPLVSSGIDVWVKSVRAPVLDRWYAKKAPASYHHDTGEGADFFDVGPTLGAGGVAVWRNDSLYRPPNFTGWKIIADGPVRVTFEMRHPAFDAGGTRVSVIRRVSLDAGQNLSRAVTIFHADNGAAIPYAIGLVKRAGVVGSESSAQRWAWLSEWGPVDHKNGGHGDLGTAVVIPRDEVRDWKETSDHYLAVSEARSDQPVIEYIGAGWTGSGDFTDVRDWWKYLDEAAARIAAPVRVTLSPSAPR
jgi:pectinesterase